MAEVSRPLAALTFDDGPGEYTGLLLDCLEKHRAAATFFTVGSRLALFPDTVRRAAAIGCEIGNHTWEHLNAPDAGPEATADSVKRTSEAVMSLTGRPTYLYRPCYGNYTGEILRAAGLPAITWSVDTEDWKTKDEEATYRAVTENIFDGAIVLMHDVHLSTVRAAVRLIPELLSRGYGLVTVSELLARRGGAKPGKIYKDGN